MQAKNLLLSHFSQRYHISPLTTLKDPMKICSISMAVDFLKFDSNSVSSLSSLQGIQTGLAKAWEARDDFVDFLPIR